MNGSAQLTSAFRSGEKSDRRIDRLPALFVEKGEVPSAFLPAGPFETQWTGSLKLAKRQRLIFSFEGEGEAVEKHLYFKGESKDAPAPATPVEQVHEGT